MTSSEAEAKALTAARLVEKISHVLAGHPPEVQGAVLADLLAMWLAGHFVSDDNDETQRLRDGLLAEHLKVVCDLVKPNQEMILERVRKGSS